LSRRDLEREAMLAAQAFWSWRNLARRVRRRVFGIGGRRMLTPWHYLKRQLGCKFMVRAGMLMYVEGGLFRRRRVSAGRRQVVSDEEARQYYLGGRRIDSGLASVLSDALPIDEGWDAAALARGTLNQSASPSGVP